MFGWLFRNRAFLFAWATVTGFLFALVWKQYEHTVHRALTYYRITPSSFDYQWAYDAWLAGLGLTSAPLRSRNASVLVEPEVPATKTKAAPSSPGTEDRWLYDRIPVFCIVLSRKLKQTRAVKNTWAKHCNGVAFYGSFSDRSIPVKKVTNDGRGRKEAGDANVQCEALRETWRNRKRDLRWVLVVTDRTYAVVENLRYMVAGLESGDTHYLGHAFRDYDGDFNVEDSGYVLSYGALEAFNRRFATAEECSLSEYWSSGDRTIGKALDELGVRPRDTRDTLERSRFLPFSLDKLLVPGSISVFNRYWRESVFLSPEGSGCCSDFAVTFSDVSPDKMHMMEYVIYHLKPISHRWPPLAPPKKSSGLSTSTTKKPTKPTGKATVLELTLATTVTKNVADGQSGLAKKLPPSSSGDADDVANEIANNKLEGDASKLHETDVQPALTKNGAKQAQREIVNGHGGPQPVETKILSLAVSTTNYDLVDEDDEFFDDVGDDEEQDKVLGAKN